MGHSRRLFFTVAATVAAVLALLAPRALASMNYISDNIYIGDQHAAANMTNLIAHKISAVLNVAWDLDITYPEKFYVDSSPDPSNQHLVIQYNKVGLVDGPGNAQATLAAAVYTLDQLLSLRTGMFPSDQTKYPEPVQAVLLHCHSGHSRSVTVGALYLYYLHPELYDTYADALDFVVKARGRTDVVPQPALTALATSLAPYPILDWFPAHENPSPGPSPSPSGLATKGSKSRSLSGGMITLVIFAVLAGLFALYCAVGMFVNHSRGHEGLDLLPHVRFWTGLCQRRDPYAVRLPAYDFN